MSKLNPWTGGCPAARPFSEGPGANRPIPGVAHRTAEQIMAEIGTDMKTRFPSAPHLCSWVGLVPGHNESAGKRNLRERVREINI